MITYRINKGVDQPIQFKGLKSQFLYMFFGGVGLVLLVSFLLTLMIGILPSIVIGVLGLGFVAYYTYYLNKHYGEFGIMKARSRRSQPDYLLNKKTVREILNTNRVNKL